MSRLKIYAPTGYETFSPDTQMVSFPLSDSDTIEYAVFPGFCDVHVHFREPGFSYKETISSGSRAAAAGGYTDVFTMPNLSPVPDSVGNMMLQRDIIERDAVINVHPYASITVNQEGKVLSDMEGLKDISVAFSDDGKGVQDDSLMEEAFIRAKALGKITVAHCEVNSLLNGGYIHDGEYARAHGHRGISSESEWRMIERDLALAKKTGAKYHVCHISAKESVELIRKAKAEGTDVTCETAPHYLLLDDSYLKEEGRFKMNPPLRSPSDREALLDGLLDGTIDMIATDHAPHSAEEKSKGLEKSSFGITGIETAFPLLYTYLVREGVITMEKLLGLLCVNPRKRFALPFTDDFTVFLLGRERRIDPDEFISMGHATPFEGTTVYADCLMTVCNSNIAYQRKEL